MIDLRQGASSVYARARLGGFALATAGLLGTSHGCGAEATSDVEIVEEACREFCSRALDEAQKCPRLPDEGSLNLGDYFPEYGTRACISLCRSTGCESRTPPYQYPREYTRWVECLATAAFTCDDTRGLLLIGCDEAMLAMADACGFCVSPWSLDTPGCTDEKSVYHYCGENAPETSPACWPGCEPVGAGSFCCEEEYVRPTDCGP
jgi:hypothetical protein